MPGYLDDGVFGGEREQRRAGQLSAAKQGREHAEQPDRGEQASERGEPARAEDRVGG